MTERLHFDFSLSCIGGGNGNPLQCSCLENPRDGEPGGLPSMGSHTESDTTEATLQQQQDHLDKHKKCFYRIAFAVTPLTYIKTKLNEQTKTFGKKEKNTLFYSLESCYQGSEVQNL